MYVLLSSSETKQIIIIVLIIMSYVANRSITISFHDFFLHYPISNEFEERIAGPR